MAIRMFSTKVLTTGYDKKFGFTSEHWETLKGAAESHNAVLFFRSGKEVAITWIRRRFPAKPLTIKVKVDNKTPLGAGQVGLGLVLCHTPEDIRSIGEAGHWVLRRSKKFPSKFEAYNPLRTGEGEAVFDAEWAREGLAIHSIRKLPFTSDYDLAGVVWTDHSIYKSLVTEARPGAGGNLQRPIYGGKQGVSTGAIKKALASLHQDAAGYTNSFTDTLTRDINIALGDVRLMHGPQSLYVAAKMPDGGGPLVPDAQLANGDDETILAFTPEKEVHVWYCRTAELSQGIMPRYYPKGLTV